MSAVKKTAKASLYIFSFFVLLLIGGAVYLYANMDSIAKQLSEKIASEALGVDVTIGDVMISLEEKKVVVSDLRIANPAGYTKPEAMSVKTITIAAESFTKELLSFARVEVDGTNVNLEVGKNGTNLGDLKKNIDSKQKNNSSDKPKENKEATSSHAKEEQIKVIVKKFSLTGAQLNPSVTLIKKDLAFINVPDIHLSGIGQKENGILAKDAIAQIMNAVLAAFNKSANGAGFLEGLSLNILNDIGVSTPEVFQKNLKKSFDKDVKQLKQGFQGLFE
ncbi:MAG: hypothetical protein ACRBDL_10995 [Alphaproteobacteria bacterium]